MISNDKRIINPSSQEARRMTDYGNLTEKLYIFILGSRGKQINLSDKVMVIPGSYRLFSPLWILWKCHALRKSGKIDLITAQDPFFAGLIGFLIKSFFGIKLQLQLHTDVLSPYFRKETSFNFIKYLLTILLIPRSDGLRVVSHRVYNSIINKFPKYPKKRIIVLPIFMETTINNNAVHLREKYRDYEFIILMASRFTREKNIPLAIMAMKNIVAEYPKTLLLIVGDGPLKQSYIQLTADYNLSRNIKIENWSEQMPAYFQMADLFLLTSNYEGYGRTLIEAAAAGCKIISSNVGIADELLEKSNIFQPNDLNSLIIKIKTAISGGLEPARDILLETKNEYLKNYLKSWEICL